MVRIRRIGIILVVALAFVAAFAPQAFAVDNVQLNAPTTVSDDITRLHVDKLDADTHEQLAGATMAIINEKTGEIVDSWVTGKSTHENEKGLDVNVVYILRELEAPEGYDKVEDVRFVVNETEGTGITVLSQGSDSELTESYKVSLYDKAKPIEREITVTKTPPNEPAPKTGDETPLAVVAGLVGAGLALIVILQLVKRAIRRS
ncbi:MAG: LPXTG cell wall anchor domain-containing protein [Eggerthellaceae bacterium]|nr:LPXTG cell wall anchor domain-containing protein [Eggerthellaceae bacterium]